MKIINDSSLCSKLLNILFFCFPVAFLTGNASLNLIIVLIVLIGLLAFSKEIYALRKESFFYFVLIFFFCIFLSTVIDILSDPRNDHFFKSIFYLRYFIFFLVAAYFIKSKKFNFRYFIISSFFCASFFSLDIIFQFIVGSDFFGFRGYEKSSVHLAGFLRDDYKAGAYIQKFFIFGFIFFPFISNKFKKHKFIISIFLTVLFFSGILFSGNRMPMFAYIFSIILMIIFIKDFRLPLTIGLLFCSIIFYSSLKNNQNLKDSYFSFYDNASRIIYYVKENAFQEYIDKTENNNELLGYFENTNHSTKNWLKTFNNILHRTFKKVRVKKKILEPKIDDLFSIKEELKSSLAEAENKEEMDKVIDINEKNRNYR